jgi:hypothetical protein
VEALDGLAEVTHGKAVHEFFDDLLGRDLHTGIVYRRFPNVGSCRNHRAIRR